MAGDIRRQASNQHISRTDFSSSRAGLHVVQLDANGTITDGKGTEYTDGDTDASPSGMVVMFGNSSNTIRAASTATPLPVALQDSTPYSNSTLSTGAWAVKASSGRLTAFSAYNPNSSVAYVQLFDASTITLGTTVAKWTLPISPGAVSNLSGLRWRFGTGLVAAATESPRGSSAMTTALVVNVSAE